MKTDQTIQWAIHIQFIYIYRRKKNMQEVHADSCTWQTLFYRKFSHLDTTSIGTFVKAVSMPFAEDTIRNCCVHNSCCKTSICKIVTSCGFSKTHFKQTHKTWKKCQQGTDRTWGSNLIQMFLWHLHQNHPLCTWTYQFAEGNLTESAWPFEHRHLAQLWLQNMIHLKRNSRYVRMSARPYDRIIFTRLKTGYPRKASLNNIDQTCGSIDICIKLSKIH